MESLGRMPLCRQVPSQTRNATNFLHLFEEETAQENCILTRNFCSGLTATVTEWWPTGSSARPCDLLGSTRLRRNCRSSSTISSQSSAPTEATPLIFWGVGVGWGGARGHPCPKLLALFQEVHFWSIKWVLFLKLGPWGGGAGGYVIRAIKKTFFFFIGVLP